MEGFVLNLNFGCVKEEKLNADMGKRNFSHWLSRAKTWLKTVVRF